MLGKSIFTLVTIQQSPFWLLLDFPSSASAAPSHVPPEIEQLTLCNLCFFHQVGPTLCNSTVDDFERSLDAFLNQRTAKSEHGFGDPFEFSFDSCCIRLPAKFLIFQCLVVES